MVDSVDVCCKEATKACRRFDGKAAPPGGPAGAKVELVEAQVD